MPEEEKKYMMQIIKEVKTYYILKEAIKSMVSNLYSNKEVVLYG